MWQSSDPSVISTGGVVKRPSGKLDKMVVLTANIYHNNTKYIEKTFEVTVLTTQRDNTSKGGGGGGGAGGNRGTGGGYMMPPDVTQDDPVKPLEQPQPKPRFTDLGSVPWARESIEKLAELGAIAGVDGERFDPDGTVTRGQFIKMLIGALGLTAKDTGCVFTDVNENDWYYDAVSAAGELGIVDGYEDGTFGADREITRQEMAVMAYRATMAAGIALNKLQGEVSWSDGSEIAGYALEAVSVMQQAGIINGFPGDVFNPGMNATRAQAAVMICRLTEVK